MSCSKYESSQWCVPDGDPYVKVDPVGGGGNYGPQWNFGQMMTFEDYAGPCPTRPGGDKAGGVGANQACCACGGGVRTGPSYYSDVNDYSTCKVRLLGIYPLYTRYTPFIRPLYHLCAPVIHVYTSYIHL